MKQVVQSYRTGELKVAEAPAPRVGEGSLLVATRISLISSGTERQLIDLAKASLAGKAMARPDLVRRVVRNIQRDGLQPTIEKVFAKLDTPIPLGYSLAGEVLEVGRRVGGVAVGDRLACAGAGLANHAEINAIPKNLTVAIPADVDDEDASFVTLGAIAMQGVRLAVPTLGERIVVMGLGLIGLLTVQLLKANGCRVLGFDPNAARVSLALELGADVAVSDSLAEAAAGFTNGHGADAVILTASSKSSEPINVAAEISRLKGRIVVVGLVGMTIDREPFYKRELELKLSMSYGPGRGDPSYEQGGQDYPLPYVRWTEQRNMEAFLALVADGKVTPKRLVTHRFAIAEAEKAYELMESGAPHLAILLTYPEAPKGPIERSIRLSSAAAEKRWQPSRLHRPRQLRQGRVVAGAEEGEQSCSNDGRDLHRSQRRPRGREKRFRRHSHRSNGGARGPRDRHDFRRHPARHPCVPGGGRAKGRQTCFLRKASGDKRRRPRRGDRGRA